MFDNFIYGVGIPTYLFHNILQRNRFHRGIQTICNFASFENKFPRCNMA